MKTTYRAVQVAGPGRLEFVECDVPVPGRDEVLIAVEACGICGADAGDIEGADPAVRRVPGHEVVGRIAALGADVPTIWTLGQRVGIGRLGGHCNVCPQCRQGHFQLCENQPFVGATVDGGYAEMMLARATGLVAIPDALDAEEAAPILCAGLATFNALKRSGAEAGDTVAVLGIGGLGHMAVQYGKRMGFRVIAIGRSDADREDALALGASAYVNTAHESPVDMLKAHGGAAAIVSTIGDVDAITRVLPGLAPRGQLIVLGAGKTSLPVSLGPMVVGERSIVGSLTGTPFDNEKTLSFSVLADVRPRFETMPLERAAEAYQRMRSGTVKYRVVLTMKDDANAHQ